MKSLHNPAFAITAATAMMFIGSQSALAAVACLSYNPKATISIDGGNCTTGGYTGNIPYWKYGADGDYTCPCIGGQPSYPTITCNAGSGSSTGSTTSTNPVSGTWGCNGTTTVADSGVWNYITNMTVNLVCKNAFGSSSASASELATCPDPTKM